MARTPGPWTLDRLHEHPGPLGDERRNWYCPLHGVDCNDEANARLIAAAPDLLAALEMAMVVTPHYLEDAAFAKAARAAIKQAKGEV